MDRSHLGPLLVAAFAVLVLGVAAGSLNTATSVGPPDADSSVSGGGGGGSSASSDRSGSSDRTIDHLLFPDLTVDSRVTDRRLGSGRISNGVLLGVGLLILGVATVVFRLTGDDDRAVADPTPGNDVPVYESESYTTVIENPPSSNGVDRAWRAMVDFADVDESVGDTPTDLARKTTANGLPKGPIDELTALFCAVRYGKTPPTAEREERARTAFEEIRRTARPPDSAGKTSDTDT